MKKLMTAVLAMGAIVASAARVEVDFNQVIGPVKPVNAVGQPPMNGALQGWTMLHWLKRAGIPYSRLHDIGGWLGGGLYVDVPNLFKNFDADENDPKNYTFKPTDSLISALMVNGVEPFFRLGVTIENFVENGFPRVNTNPPKDYAKWARICEHIIRHYTEGWADGFNYKITYWEIWNEPENNPVIARNPMWGGDWQSYCDFYGTVAPYLKGKFPHLKIGGYGHCGFYAAVGSDQVAAANSSPRTQYFVECSHKFLKQARDNKWPLDFFSYHSYSDPVEALRQVRFADEHLNEYGFTRDKTERIFNEWLPRPSHQALGTAHQAAMIAAELIGLQNGPCDLACLYDARCGKGNYSPLFDPMTYGPHKAYFAFLDFNYLREAGQAVKASADDKDVWVAAAKGGNKAVVMLANYSERDIAVDFDFGGRKAKSYSITDEKYMDHYELGVPKTLPPNSLISIFLNEVPPTWEKPKTCKRYLQGPRSSRLGVMCREGKLVLGDTDHVHDWHAKPYSSVWSQAIWLMHGAAPTAFDFRAAELKVDPDAVPLTVQTMKDGALEVEISAAVPFGRFPNAHMRVKAVNRGAAPLKDSLAFLFRRWYEKDLINGAPDCYEPYNPTIDDWLRLRTWTETPDTRTLVEGDTFVTFSEDVKWDEKVGAARIAMELAPGETKVVDVVLGKQLNENDKKFERPHFDEIAASVRADWKRELAKVSKLTLLQKHLVVQMLQCFARPNQGDYVIPRQGGLQRWVWPGDQRAVSYALDMLGYYDYVEDAIDFYFNVYKTDSGEIGKFGNDWASDTASCLDVFAKHTLAKGDRAVWAKYRDQAMKSFEWVAAKRAPDGLYPIMKSTDAGDVYRNWGFTDVNNLMAIERFAAAAKLMADPNAARVAQVAGEYRAAFMKAIDKFRKIDEGKDTLYIPHTPDHDGNRLTQTSSDFYGKTGGYMIGLDMLSKADILRVLKFMEDCKGADFSRGLCHRIRDAVPMRGAEGNWWYTTWVDQFIYQGCRNAGLNEIADKILEGNLKYTLSDEFMACERYHAADPWRVPWQPNASACGRLLTMMLDK